MKTTKTFENATIRTVNNGYIELDYNGKTDCFHNASVISVNNGSISIEVDWEPKEGELVKITGNCIDAYSIFHRYDKSVDTIVDYGYKRINNDKHAFCQSYWFPGPQTEIYPVTPEEQQAFDDFCKSKGKIWNKEKLQWEKYRWKPLTNDWYYVVNHSYPNAIKRLRWENDPIDDRYYDNHNCFQTREQALKAAEKVKEFLKSL